MLTLIPFNDPQDEKPAFLGVDDPAAKIERLDKEVKQLKKAIREYFSTLNGPGNLNITQTKIQNSTLEGSSVDNTTIGATTASSGLFTTVGASGRMTASGGFRVIGDWGLGASDSHGVFSYASSVTRAFIGDGTGYAWKLSKRVSSTTTDYFTFTDDGRFYGSALHNNAGAVTGATNQYIASGTYSPTITEVTNSSGSALVGGATWVRVGNVVTVSGLLTADAVALGLVQIGISLPIASTLAAASDLSGGASIKDNVTGNIVNAGYIVADTTNNRANLDFYATTTTGVAGSYWFQYEVL